MADHTALAVTALGAAGLVCGLGYYAISYPGSQVFGTALIAPRSPEELALTFDDGPNPVATPQLLETLGRHGVRATFFLIGNYVRQEPGLTREIAAAGHEVGNHTMSHPWLPRLSARRIREELEECNQALEDTLGQAVRFFRPPHGARSPAVLRAAEELELKTVQWNLIVDDWKPVAAAVLQGRLEQGIARNRGRGRGTNVVLHDGGQSALGEPRLATVEAVGRVLDGLPRETRLVTPEEF